MTPGEGGTVAVLLDLPRRLDSVGVPTDPARRATFLAALARLGCTELTQVRRGAAATLCSSPEDLDALDRVLPGWWRTWFGAGHGGVLEVIDEREAATAALGSGPASETADADDETQGVDASDADLLRSRDIAALSEAERRRLTALFEHLTPRPPLRRHPRRTPRTSGDADLRRTARATLRRLGEPAPLQRSRRVRVRRPVVVVLDVSGSMRPYADAYLRLAHRLVRTGVATEVFTLGSRLSDVGAALRAPEAEDALAAVGAIVPDWAGGTRLADGLARLRADHAHRLRGAVVLLASDGWERGEPDAFAREVELLAGVARRLVWMNPHRGKAGYAPVQAGVVAALPHVDDFVAGHSIEAFSAACAVLARA